MTETTTLPNSELETEQRSNSYEADERSRRVKWMIGLGLCAIASLGLAIESFGPGLKYRFIAKRWGVVVPGQVFRSGQLSKWMIDKQVRENHLGAVIDMNGVEQNDPHQEHEIQYLKKAGIPLYRFSMRGDGTGEIVRHADAIETIVRCQADKTPVLVHCSAGAQRTGGVVAMYRVLVQGWSAEKAREEMVQFDFKPKRDLELIPFLNEHIATLAQMLVERGVIDRVPDPLPRFRP